MKTTLTKSEKKYIVAMYEEVLPNITKIKDIKDMPVGCAALFMENREEEPKEVWPDDHSISEKHLTAYGLSLNMTYKQWMVWARKQEKTLTIKTKKNYPTLIKL